MSINRGVDKENVKKKKKKRKCVVFPFETTWMELEGIMLSEISPTKKDKYYNDLTYM